MSTAPVEVDSRSRQQTGTTGSIVSGELRTLGRHSVDYLAGFVGTMALGLVSFPVFTRVFSVAQFGMIDLVQRVLLIFTAFSKLGLQHAALRFSDVQTFSQNPAKERRFYSTMCLGTTGASAVCVMMFLGFLYLFPRSWIAAPLQGLWFWIAALILIRALQSILCCFLRIEERTTAFNVVAIGTKACTIAAVCGLLSTAGRKASTFFAGTTAVEAAAVLLMLACLLRRGLIAPRSFDPGLFRAGIAFGLPLVIYESAFAVLNSADRFLVRHYLGSTPLGIYSVAYGLSQTVNDLIVTPLGLALMPIYMRLWTSAGREATIGFLSSALKCYLVVAAGILCVSSAAAPDVVVLLSSAKYAGAEGLIPMLLAGLLVYTTHMFLAAGLLLQKRTLPMAAVLFCCSLVNIGLNCLFLPVLGLKGGALATLLSYGVCILFLWRLSKGYLPLPLDFDAMGKCCVAGTTAWLVASSIHLRPAALGFAATSTISFAIYLGIVLSLDSVLRAQVARGLQLAAVSCRGLLSRIQSIQAG